ncbi:hypothetical protein KX928_00710 [Roseobacter sp. YSTF-M11]|uniref:Uncharacterized protein n=1 Tax=Roseobacter insulae TaxID=2859783 RepID=A0A9X1FSG4_9RHOB|nr:hypothetical protein [Roseobacter insulae]MBW4706300.1 hypothetical protein [Roseobacter insulae]
MNIAKNTGPVMLSIWALLLFAGLIALGFGRWSLAFVSLATLALSLVPPLLASRWSLTLPVPFLFATTLFIFASVFLGEALDFYERLWWWDLALHGISAFGFGLTGFLFVFMLFEGDRFAAPPSAIAFITFCVAMTIGGMWEIFEFLMDETFGLNMQKSGLVDTIGDLMINAVGSFAASLTGYVYLVRNSAGPLGRALSEFISLNRRLYQKSKDRLKK